MAKNQNGAPAGVQNQVPGPGVTDEAAATAQAAGSDTPPTPPAAGADTPPAPPAPPAPPEPPKREGMRKIKNEACKGMTVYAVTGLAVVFDEKGVAECREADYQQFKQIPGFEDVQ